MNSLFLHHLVTLTAQAALSRLEIGGGATGPALPEDDFGIELSINERGQILMVLPDGRDSYEGVTIPWPRPLSQSLTEPQILAMLEADTN